ncbi:MAG: hypothetical protein QME60_07100 [Verrucomicrobiota bacterium]|nr:hypothetical protein [Verrucomicrobiota bacterium]
MADDVVWAGPFESNALQRVIHSPARDKIARDILSGVSCVWVFVESGRKETDDAKRKLLEERLALIKKEVRLPEESYSEAAQGQMAGVAPLKIDFTVVSISRGDPNEQVFLNMLLRAEPDHARNADKPMAFPIFGQGRAIWALVSDGINPEVIENACGFILGFCSCEIKDMNPGTDMLMNVDWYSAVTNLMSAPDKPPELVGVAALAEQEKTPAPAVEALVPPPPAAPRDPPGRRLRFVVLGGLGALLALAVIIGIFLGRTKEGDRWSVFGDWRSVFVIET